MERETLKSKQNRKFKPKINYKNLKLEHWFPVSAHSVKGENFKRIETGDKEITPNLEKIKHVLKQAIDSKPSLALSKIFISPRTPKNALRSPSLPPSVKRLCNFHMEHVAFSRSYELRGEELSIFSRDERDKTYFRTRGAYDGPGIRLLSCGVRIGQAENCEGSRGWRFFLTELGWLQSDPIICTLQAAKYKCQWGC